ncbi:MAG: hypothetical protein AAGG75_05765 [Bacteroidota bacterium]
MSIFSDRKRERISNLKKVAYELDLNFTASDEYGLIALLRDFALFRRGHSKKIYNILHQKDEWHQSKLHLFDYKYVIGGGNNTRVLRQTVFFLQSKQLGLPQFLMKPEHFFHRIGNYLGWKQDIDFAEFPEFSKQYLLQGEDEEMVRYVMTNDMLNFFTVEKDWSLEGINYFLIFYAHNRLLSPKAIIDFYNKGMYLFDLLRQEPSDEFL